MNSFTKAIRLFVDGVFDETSAAIVDVRIRSIIDVVECQVLPSGLCTIQVAPNTLTTDIELRLLKHLTFDK